MCDISFVGGLETIGDLARDSQRFLQRESTLRQAFFLRRAFDQLQHERTAVVFIFETVDRSDIRMIERG